MLVEKLIHKLAWQLRVATVLSDCLNIGLREFAYNLFLNA